MKTLITAALVAVTLSACSVNAPVAPVATDTKPAPTPDSCEARHDQAPCKLTNEQALIEILQMSQTNQLIQCTVPAKTWQDMLLPPTPTGECK